MRRLVWQFLVFLPSLSFANTISTTIDFTQPVTFLLELSSSPLIEARQNSLGPLSNYFSTLRIEHQKIKSALMGFQQTKIQHEYFFVMNGFSLLAPREFQSKLEKLPGVSQVLIAQAVSIPPVPKLEEIEKGRLDDSVSLIGAKALHEKGIRGEGRIIAILDTGIDSSHPAFARVGKIKKTYNAITGEEDVIDGHGHGTHVAGIAAGNGGEIVGVAPDAQLMVIKALSDKGSGSEADIIEGMERAADIDQNPETVDHVDVISMSLGTSSAGASNDMMSQVVNRLSSAGIVFTIAAGNSGIGGIGSPGVAEKAITVGASTKYDSMAGFSSIGPVDKTFALKPDVLAPGVLIKSSLPGNQYAEWNGTSMATPHVAGAAALLLQQHPDWKPEDVKQALMFTAKPLQGISAFSQGWGRVQLVSASLPTFSPSPSFFYLGLYSSFSGSNSITPRLNFKNTTENVQHLKIQELRPIPGITWVLPPELDIPPNGSVDIPLNITIDQSTLSFPMTERMAHEPSLLLQIGREQKILPVYLIRGLPITVHADSGSLELLNLKGGFSKRIYNFPGGNTTEMLPMGTYAMTYSGFPLGEKDFYFVRKTVVIDQNNREINLGIDQASHTILIDHRDETGSDCVRKVPTMGVFQNWKPMGFDFAISATIGLYKKTTAIHMSDENYLFSLSSKCLKERDYSVIARPPGKVAGDEVLTNPAKMIPVKVDINPNLKDPKFWISDLHCHFYGCIGSFQVSATLTDIDRIWFDGNSVNLKWFIVKDQKGVFRESSYFYVDQEGIGHFGYVGNFHRHIPLKTWNVGYPSLMWQGIFENRKDMIGIRNPDQGMNPFLFFDSSWFIYSGNPSYELRQDGVLIEKGEIEYNAGVDWVLRFHLPTSPGRQELTVFSNPIDTPEGESQLQVSAEFDPEAKDPNPPNIRKLEILKEGAPSFYFSLGEKVGVQFEANDKEGGVDQIKVFVRKSGEAWEVIPTISKGGDTFFATFQPSLTGQYDVEVLGIDKARNSTRSRQLFGFLVK